MIRFLAVFFFILTSSSFAEIKKVNIIGNSRVNSNTIDLLVDKLDRQILKHKEKKVDRSHGNTSR